MPPSASASKGPPRGINRRGAPRRPSRRRGPRARVARAPDFGDFGDSGAPLFVRSAVAEPPRVRGRRRKRLPGDRPHARARCAASSRQRALGGRASTASSVPASRGRRTDPGGPRRFAARARAAAAPRAALRPAPSAPRPRDLLLTRRARRAPGGAGTRRQHQAERAGVLDAEAETVHREGGALARAHGEKHCSSPRGPARPSSSSWARPSSSSSSSSQEEASSRARPSSWARPGRERPRKVPDDVVEELPRDGGRAARASTCRRKASACAATASASSSLCSSLGSCARPHARAASARPVVCSSARSARALPPRTRRP